MATRESHTTWSYCRTSSKNTTRMCRYSCQCPTNSTPLRTSTLWALTWLRKSLTISTSMFPPNNNSDSLSLAFPWEDSSSEPPFLLYISTSPLSTTSSLYPLLIWELLIMPVSSSKLEWRFTILFTHPKSSNRWISLTFLISINPSSIYYLLTMYNLLIWFSILFIVLEQFSKPYFYWFLTRLICTLWFCLGLILWKWYT